MSLLSKVKDIFKSGSSAKRKKVYHNVRLDNPEENWDIIGELGDGAYGKVYKAEHRDNGQLAALKQVNLEAEDDLETFMIEIDILCECKHPNVVELLEAYHYDGKLWMYLEYCDGGAVDSIMVDLDRPLTEPQIALLCYGLCNALIYIHANKIIHRDLKAGNVLLTMDGGVKLADFGVSAKNKNTFDKRGTFIGTPYWLAPEVILCETFIDAKYDYKADIWSLGISLIEFAQMDPPNHEVSPVRVMLKIQKSDPPKLEFPSKWSKDFNDFIAKCLTKDPVLRPDAEELLKHPFLSKPLDRKPLTDLLLEYKADVVEEDVEEDSEDHDPSRLSTVSEPFSNTSKFDTESLISIDKDNALQSIDEKLPSPTLDDREVSASSSSEKRIVKGPAPLPPAININNQPSPKKGPAPAIPSSPTTSPSSTSITAVSTVTSSSTEILATSETILVHSTETLTSTTVTSPNKFATFEGVEDISEASSYVASTPTSEKTKSALGTLPCESPIVPPDNYIPEDKKIVDSEVSIPVLEEENFIDSIPVGKSVYVYDMETYDKNIVPVNTAVIDDARYNQAETVIATESISGRDGVVTTAETQLFITDETTKLNVDTSHSSFTKSQDVPASVTLSVVSSTPDTLSSVAEDKVSQSSDMLIASISSEGTVIVRTPTPTPSSVERTKKNDSVVTYTVTGDSEIDSNSEISLETTIPLSHNESQLPSSTKDDALIDGFQHQQSFDSMGDAEAQAVLILETAINSAMDSSFSQEDSLSTAKGEVVVVALEEASELDTSLVERINKTDASIVDISGHKLDESEVLITSSSIPEEEQKELAKHSIDASLNETSSHVVDSLITSPSEVVHVSVVSVDEGKENVKIVTDSSVTTDEYVIDGSETAQVSLTIEGTTLEDTDVDEVENSTSTAMATGSDARLTQEKESVISSSEDKNDKLDGISTSRSTASSAPVVDRESSPTVNHPKISGQEEVTPLQPIQNGIRRQNSRASDRSDTDTASTMGSDKENRHQKEELEISEEVPLRHPGGRRPVSSAIIDRETAAKNLKNKELQASIALRKKTRKRTRKFVIDGVVVTTTTSKVIYGDDEEQGILSSAHLARKQELRELKLVQKREQKDFQELASKANTARLEQEKKFEIERINLLRNYDSQIENLIRQQKQLVEKAEGRQESELKFESKKTRIDQERELKAFRESLKQEWKLLKQEVDLLPKDRRKENFKIRKDHLERDQTEREKACLERLNDSHEMALKRLNDKHRKHIALKERQFLEEKHQLLRARESALWDMEERHIQDKHQLAKEQLKDIYFLQRLQMTIRHNVELEQVRRFNQHKEEDLLKRQHEERRQLPKRIRQEMKTREKMFREQIRISMTQLPSHEQEKEQLKKFQEQEKIKYDKERKRAEMKHKKQMEELTASTDASIKELVHLQNEKGKLLTEHESYKLKSLDEEYQKDLKEWKSNLAPRKQKLEEDFERQLKEQEKFYGDYLERGLGLCTPAQSTSSLANLKEMKHRFRSLSRRRHL